MKNKAIILFGILTILLFFNSVYATILIDPGIAIIDYEGPYIAYNTFEYIVFTLVFVTLLIICNKKGIKESKIAKLFYNILSIIIFIIAIILASSQNSGTFLSLLYTYGYKGYVKALIGTIIYSVLIIIMAIVCLIKNKKSKNILKGENKNV